MLNIIMFGGLSECGKSHASRFLSKNSFTHIKIIFFEKLIMKRFDIDSESKSYDPFKKLYENSHELVYQKFITEIENYCKENNINNLVMDSATRLDMIQYLNDAKHNFLSVYIDTDFDKRVEREYLKLDKNIQLSVVKETTLKKDKIKFSRKADLVRKGSLIITNNEGVSEFEEKLINIYQNLLNDVK